MTSTRIDLLALPAADSAETFVLREDEFRLLYDRTSRALWVYLHRLTLDEPAGAALQRSAGDPAHGDRTDVHRAMGRMRDRDQQLLWLAYAEGSSHDEIAASLGLRPSSVRTLLFRARRRLASLLSRSSSGGQR